MNRIIFIFAVCFTFLAFVEIRVLEDDISISNRANVGSATQSVLIETLHLKKGGSLQISITAQSLNCNDYFNDFEASINNYVSVEVQYNEKNNLPKRGQNLKWNMAAGNPFNLWVNSYMNPDYEYTAQISYGITFIACPNSEYCATYTCPVCDLTYCTMHERHITANYSHGDTIHYHCTNSQSLADEWVAGCQGVCNECGKVFCKLCPHRCGDDVCPNLAGCNQVTCPKCHGVYCSKHNYHVCGNYTSIGENTGTDNISVQTTITGEAQVSVNITDNSQPTDLSGVESSLSQIGASIGNSNNNVVGISANVVSIDSHLTQLNTYLPLQLSGMNNNIVETKESLDSAVLKLNDIDTTLTTTNEGLSAINTSVEGMSSDLQETIGTTNTKLQNIYDKLDNLDFDGDLNVDLGGLGGKIDSTNTKLDAILNGNGNLGLGSVGTASPSGGIGEEIEENTLTGNEIENITKITFIDAVKNKLLPPRLNVGNYDASFSFDIPTLYGEPLHLTLDMNDNKIQAVRQAVRVVSSLTMVIVFTFGIIRMIRQY